MVSLVIPCFNEEKRLDKSLEKLAKYMNTYSYISEVIVVDDGSNDKTVQVASSFQNEIKNLKVISLGENLGKGAAVKRGFQEARSETVVFSDADFSAPITELHKLLNEVNNGYDIAIGSRALDRSLVKKRQPFLRELVGKAANILIRLGAVERISDTQCGFKAFRKKTTEPIFEKQTVSGFAFDIELLFLAQRQKLKIKEVPVLWFNDSLSQVRVRDTVNAFVDLIKLRLRHAKDGNGKLDTSFALIYRHQTFVRFALVGASGTLVDYVSYYLLTRYLGLSPLRANPLSVELAIIWNFTLNNLWTFSKRKEQQSLVRKFLAFQFVSLGGLMISQMQILTYTHYLKIYDLLSKAMTIPLVAMLLHLVHGAVATVAAQIGVVAAPAIAAIILILF